MTFRLADDSGPDDALFSSRASSTGYGSSSSGLEVEQRASAPVHREGDRVVHVGDLPRPVLAPEARGGAEPEIDPLAVGLRPAHVTERERVGDVATDDDLRIAGLGDDGPAPGVEPLLDVRRIAHGGRGNGERRREVVGDDVAGVELDQGPGVLGPERGSEAVEQGGDLRLVGTTGRCVRHRVSPPSRAPRARGTRQAVDDLRLVRTSRLVKSFLKY